MSSGGSETRTTQNFEREESQQRRINPWLARVSRQYLSNYLNTVGGLRADDIPRSTVDIDPLRRSALEARTGMALEGSPISELALNEWTKTARGDYTDPGTNPYLRATADRMSDDASARLQGRFGGGRFGSGAWANAMADADLGARERLYGGAYEAERDRMYRALGAAPTMYGLEYADLGQLEGVGRQYEAEKLGQQRDERERFFWPVQRGQLQLQAIAASPLRDEAFVTGSQSGTASGTTTQEQAFDWGQFFGTALLGGAQVGAAALTGGTSLAATGVPGVGGTSPGTFSPALGQSTLGALSSGVYRSPGWGSY